VISRAEIIGGIGMVLFAGLVILLTVLRIWWPFQMALVLVFIAFFFWAGMVLVHDWLHRNRD
jgi:hypothetical protein